MPNLHMGDEKVPFIEARPAKLTHILFLLLRVQFFNFLGDSVFDFIVG